ncbi:MAG: hypothetical protein ACI35S_04260 [Anaeroplasma sp.]
MKKSKKRKEKYIDDGHTIYNMDIEGFKWHDQNIKKQNKIYTDKKERRAMIIAAFKVYIPKLFIILIGFSLAFILIYIWLK